VTRRHHHYANERVPVPTSVIAYLDTSAIVSLLIAEPGSARMPSPTSTACSRNSTLSRAYADTTQCTGGCRPNPRSGPRR